MSLDNRTTETDSYGTTLAIVGGKWTLRCAEDTPGAIERALTKGENEGKIVHELKYASLSGHLAGGRIVSGNYGKTAEIDLIDYKTEDRYTVGMSLDSRYLFDFIKRLPNLDTSREIRLELVEHKTKRTKKGTPVHNLHAVQNERMVSDFYIEWKREPGEKAVPTLLHGLPEPIEGIKGWNFDSQEEFLLVKFEEYFAGYAVPESDIPPLPEEEPSVAEDTAGVATPADEYEDDIPF